MRVIIVGLILSLLWKKNLMMILMSIVMDFLKSEGFLMVFFLFSDIIVILIVFLFFL